MSKINKFWHKENNPKIDGLYFVKLIGSAPSPWYESAWYDVKHDLWDLPEESKKYNVIAWAIIPEE